MFDIISAYFSLASGLQYNANYAPVASYGGSCRVKNTCVVCGDAGS